MTTKSLRIYNGKRLLINNILDQRNPGVFWNKDYGKKCVVTSQIAKWYHTAFSLSSLYKGNNKELADYRICPKEQVSTKAIRKTKENQLLMLSIYFKLLDLPLCPNYPCMCTNKRILM